MPLDSFVNPEIIMGYRSPDLSGLDPSRMMANVLAYKQAKTQQQANALALQQKQQEAADQALLQEATNQSDPVNYLRGLGRLDIANAYAAQQQEQQGKKLQFQTQEQELENAKRKAANEQFLALAPQRYAELQNVSTPEDYMKWHLANPELYGTDKAARTAQIQEALAQEGGLQKQISGSKSALETILGIKPVDTGPKFGTYQPGDYTTASWAKFTTTKNPADLQLKPTAPGTSVNVGVSTAKGIAENVGDIAKTSRTQATGAIKTMTSANEIRNALNSGLVIAGPTADLQMKFNQFLTEAGKGSPEKSKQLAQTRTAIINLSKLTLAARAELQGSGAISDFETKLLERAQSGDINDMSVEELQTVVDAAQKGAQFLWGEHQGLLDTMKSDPETAKLARYYTPASKMPEAAGRTSTTTSAGAKAMPTGDKLKTYADQHFNGDQTKAKAFLSTQGYK